MKQAVLTSKVSITNVRLDSLFNFQGPEKGAERRPEQKIWGYSSAGRAPALQAGGLRFDPAYLHHKQFAIRNAGCAIVQRGLGIEPKPIWAYSSAG